MTTVNVPAVCRAIRAGKYRPAELRRLFTALADATGRPNEGLGATTMARRVPVVGADDTAAMFQRYGVHTDRAVAFAREFDQLSAAGAAPSCGRDRYIAAGLQRLGVTL